MPPAYAQPNPADNSAAGVHWITSIPSKLPCYMHLPIALHEAWPGHLMHLALIQELTDLPAFRRHGAMHYSACLEGWALYCEGLGEDMGLYNTPEKRYGRLEMEMWRARSEEHTSELQSLMRISYAVFCLKKKKTHSRVTTDQQHSTL